MYWTRESEEAIANNDLKGYYDMCHQQLLDVTTLVRTELTNMQRVSLSALVTLDVKPHTPYFSLCTPKP